MDYREKAKHLLKALKAEGSPLAEHLAGVLGEMSEDDVNESIRTVSRLVPSIGARLIEQGIDINEGAGVKVKIDLRIDKFNGDMEPGKQPYAVLKTGDSFRI
jgi:hypothetical protein